MYKCFPFLKACSGQADSLDKRHASLQAVPEDVFRNGRTLEECMLDSNQIKELPKKIFAITQLKRLTLSDNALTRIPPNIGNLTALMELDVSRNEISEFPENIKFCSDLRILDMSSNPIQGLPPGLCQLKNLTSLNLNDITLGELPNDFGNLNALRRLELRDNLLKSLPPSFGALQCLEFLDLGGNEFADLPPQIGQLRALAELFLDANELKTLPPQIGALKCLFQLDVSENFLEYLPDEFCHLGALTDLTLTQNNLDTVPEAIGNLRRLSMLKLDSNRLVSLSSQIGYCASLEEVYLTDNLLSTLPPTIGNLSRLINLNVDRNRLASLVPEVGRCRSLNILSLRDNRLAWLPRELGELSQLHVLDVAGNKLDRLPVAITACPLKALWLSEKQSQPIVNLQTDEDPVTGEQFLTCYMLPQEGHVPGEEQPPAYAPQQPPLPPYAASAAAAAAVSPHRPQQPPQQLQPQQPAAVQPRHPAPGAGSDSVASYAADLRQSASRDSANLRLKHHPRFDKRNVDGPVIHHREDGAGGKELSFAPKRISPEPEDVNGSSGGGGGSSSSSSGSDDSDEDDGPRPALPSPPPPPPQQLQQQQPPQPAKRTSTAAAPVAAAVDPVTQQSQRSPPRQAPPPVPAAATTADSESASDTTSATSSESESSDSESDDAPTPVDSASPAKAAAVVPLKSPARLPPPPPPPPPPQEPPLSLGGKLAPTASESVEPEDEDDDGGSSTAESEDDSSSSGSGSSSDSESESEAAAPVAGRRPPTPPPAPTVASKPKRATEDDLSSGGEEIDQLRHVGFTEEASDNESKTPSLKRRDTPHYNKNARISKNQDPQYVIQVIEKYQGAGGAGPGSAAPATAADPADAMVVLPSAGPPLQQPEVVRAVAPVAAVARRQLRQHRIVIDRQPGVSLGISIAGGLGSSPWRPGDHSIFTSKVAAGKPAYAAGLRAGDRLLAVNEHPMVGAEHNAAVEAMKKCGSQMRLLVEREEDVVAAADEEPAGDVVASGEVSPPTAAAAAVVTGALPPPPPYLGTLPELEELNSQMQLRSQAFHVTLTRDPAKGSGLGFSIAGGRGSLPRGVGAGDDNIYISRVTPNGAADSAKLQVGDRILKINSQDVSRCSHEEAVSLLTAQPSVSLELARELVYPKTPENGGSSSLAGVAAASPTTPSPYPTEEIVLALDSGQMGLSICGGVDHASYPFGANNEPGVFVSKIVPGGAASRTSLRVGDRILAVNGRDIRQAAHREAVAALKESLHQRIRLTVRHDPPPPGLQALTIHKADVDRRLGITISGGLGSPPANPADPADEGVFVSRLTPGGVFSEDGRIKPGMRLLEVNGRTLLGVTREEAVAILRDLPAEIRVTVCDGFQPPALSSATGPTVLPQPPGASGRLRNQSGRVESSAASRPRLESTTSIDRDEEVENLKEMQQSHGGVAKSLDSDLIDAQHLLQYQQSRQHRQLSTS